MGLDTQTYRLTDRQSQCDFDFGQTQTERRERQRRERQRRDKDRTHTEIRDTEKRETEERSKTQIKKDPSSRSKEEPGALRDTTSEGHNSV
jgi:hypothetical protein